LTDKGEGSPDVTSDDGFYSAFLPYPSTANGYFSIEILATNNDGTKIAIKSSKLGETVIISKA
jgi:hypothetical protein